MPRGAGVREGANGLSIGLRRTQWPNRIGVRQQRAQLITASAKNEGRPLGVALKTPVFRSPIAYFLRRARTTTTPPTRSATAATVVEPSISGAAAPTAIRAVAVPIKTTARPRSFVIEASRLPSIPRTLRTMQYCVRIHSAKARRVPESARHAARTHGCSQSFQSGIHRTIHW
jgi:hypothetical protein